MATIVVIDDNETLREGVVEVLERMEHKVVATAGGASGLEAIERRQPELVITDLKMEDVDGMDVLRAVESSSAETMVIMMTAFGSIERAVEAMKAGAFDFIAKPFPPDLLRTRVERALGISEERRHAERLENENEMLRRDCAREFDSEIVGDSPPMQQVLSRVEQAADSDSTVFVHGESGTGKELVARALHRASPRATGPFVKVNCSALAESLLESELFGHEKGAFTGAHKQRMGRFELADGGTIFLDEIGDISPAIQLKLLRVLQEHEFERVGGEKTLHTDVRVVTATNRDLRQAVDDGDFREDLFYRLHIIPIELPPLRRRREDIEELVGHFIEKLGPRTRSDVTDVDESVLEMLEKYSWPGNVRELENVIEHALVFAEGSTIEPGDLPPMLGGDTDEASVDLAVVEQRSLPEVLEDIEQDLIERAFDRADGVKAQTARLLGIKPSALYYKLEKYGIEEGDDAEVS